MLALGHWALWMPSGGYAGEVMRPAARWRRRSVQDNLADDEPKPALIAQKQGIEGYPPSYSLVPGATSWIVSTFIPRLLSHSCTRAKLPGPSPRRTFFLCTRMANKHKTGRIVGTAGAIGLAISVLAMIYMATRPNPPSHGNSNLQLLPPPAAKSESQ